MGCAPWQLDMSCCPGWTGRDPALRARLTGSAVHIVWALTGRRYSLCEVTVRPRPAPCVRPVPIGAAMGGLPWYPALVDGRVFNVHCGCPGSCSCGRECRVRLEPGPVRDIVAVQIGPDVLAGGYQVVDGLWLVRTDGGCWPGCQALNQPDGGPGAWSVTYTYGLAPPGPLTAAAQVLCCEFSKACAADASCRLPQRVQTVVREGVSMTLLDPLEFLTDGLTGIPEVDLAIRTVNPDKLPDDCDVYSPDVRRPARITWVGP